MGFTSLKDLRGGGQAQVLARIEMFLSHKSHFLIEKRLRIDIDIQKKLPNTRQK